MSSIPSTQPDVRRVRRRGLATVATLAGVGAALSLLALSPTTALTSTAIVPAAGAPAAVRAPADKAAATAPVADQAVTSTRVAPVNRTAPAANAAPAHAMAAPAASCGGLQSAVDAFLMHFNAAHLETSPGQQVADITDVDQYTKTHTVLVENMVKPLLGGGQAALDAFLQHVYAAHLEASPGQQVADIADIDQYVKTHTVMLENMVKPLAGADLASC